MYLGQVEKLPIFVSIEVGFTEGSDSQAILGIQEEIAPDIVEHDGIFARVHVREFPPNNSKRFDLQVIKTIFYNKKTGDNQ